jgi:uncharacterized membrane protein YraQ (UPF0718 family)
MNEEKIAAAIEKAVADAFSKQPETIVCSLDLNKEIHAEEHQFIRSLMTVADRLEKIKWGFFGSVIRSTGYLVMGLLILGAWVYIKSELAKVGG